MFSSIEPFHINTGNQVVSFRLLVFTAVTWTLGAYGMLIICSIFPHSLHVEMDFRIESYRK